MRWRPMEKDDLNRYKLILNAQFKLLDKVVPDLKAVAVQEVADTDAPLSTRELAQRLSGILAITDTAGKTH